MSQLLNNKLNLDILEEICSGRGVAININALSKNFNKHRNTIKSIVEELLIHKIIDRPIYPFFWLFREYPLLITSRAELPKIEEVDRFLKEDKHIFGVFHVRDKEYNTLLIEFHKDIHSYGDWRKMIVAENKIPPRESRYPSDSLFFSVKNFVKYQPHSSLFLIEKESNNPLISEALEESSFTASSIVTNSLFPSFCILISPL